MNSEVTTDSNGFFTTVWTAPDREMDVTINVSVGKVSRVIDILVIKDTVDIEVSVMWATNIPDMPTAPAKNAEVHVFDKYGNEHVGTTDSTGIAKFSDFPVGHIEGYAIKDGYKSDYKSDRVYRIISDNYVAMKFILSTGTGSALSNEYNYDNNLKIGFGSRYTVGNEWWNPFDDDIVKDGDWIEIDHIYAKNLFNDRTTAFSFNRYGIGDNPNNYATEAGWKIKSLYVEDSAGDIVPITSYMVKMPTGDWYYFDAYSDNDFQSNFESYMETSGWESYSQTQLNSYAMFGIVGVTGRYFLFGGDGIELFSLRVHIPSDYPLPAGKLTVHISIETCEFQSGSWSANIDSSVDIGFTVPKPQYSYIYGDPPFTIEVKDDNGHIVNQNEQDIPGSYYWAEDGVILIRLPTGNYTYTLVGQENGNYTLQMGVYDNGQFVNKNYTGYINKGETQKGVVKLNSSNFYTTPPQTTGSSGSLGSVNETLGIPILWVITAIIAISIVIFAIIIARKRAYREQK